MTDLSPTENKNGGCHDTGKESNSLGELLFLRVEERYHLRNGREKEFRGTDLRSEPRSHAPRPSQIVEVQENQGGRIKQKSSRKAKIRSKEGRRQQAPLANVVLVAEPNSRG